MLLRLWYPVSPSLSGHKIKVTPSIQFKIVLRPLLEFQIIRKFSDPDERFFRIGSCVCIFRNGLIDMLLLFLNSRNKRTCELSSAADFVFWPMKSAFEKKSTRQITGSYTHGDHWPGSFSILSNF